MSDRHGGGGQGGGGGATRSYVPGRSSEKRRYSSTGAATSKPRTPSNYGSQHSRGDARGGGHHNYRSQFAPQASHGRSSSGERNGTTPSFKKPRASYHGGPQSGNRWGGTGQQRGGGSRHRHGGGSYAPHHQQQHQPQPTVFQTFASVNVYNEATKDRFEALPHDDEFQKSLESRIDEDLAPYEKQFSKPGAMFEAMKDIARKRKKFCRSALIVSIRPSPGGTADGEEPQPATISLEMPPEQRNDTSDNRRKIYRQMILDLDVWCAHRGLPLPAVDFVVYVTDTYVWERYAEMYPWLIMAKPTNRHGVLIPDNSFISHDERGGEYRGGSAAQRVLSGPRHDDASKVPQSTGTPPLPPTPSYIWDSVKQKLAQASASAVNPSEKDPVLFFKGANTGADKYATRMYLKNVADRNNKSRQQQQQQQQQQQGLPGSAGDQQPIGSGAPGVAPSMSQENAGSDGVAALPLEIDLLGSKQPMYEWAKKRVLLNLPGHQPWSYRRKYLYLLRSVVFHVDTHVEYTPEDVTGNWELFFDRAFVGGQDYVSLTQYFFDEAHPNYREGNPQKLRELTSAIAKAYDGLSDEMYSKMVASAFSKAMELSTSRILQYLYVVLVKYAKLAAPKPPRTSLRELVAADAKDLSLVEVANLQAAAASLLAAQPVT